MKFQEKYIIRDYEVDVDNHMIPSYLSYYTQETAERCITSEKLGSIDMMHIEQRAYIISKLSVEVLDTMPRYSELTVRTWVSEGHGAIYPRHYEFVIGEKVVARGTGDWAVIDTKNKKIVRWGDYDLGEVSVDEPLQLGLSRRIKLPDGYEYYYSDSFKVGHSQTDLNQHMNNVSYINPMYDNIPNVKDKLLCSFSIHFKHECVEGDVLEVWVSDPIRRSDNPELAEFIDARADEIYYVKFVKDDIVKAEAAWGFKRLEVKHE